MSRLSPHFTIAEFVKSQTAERKGIENTPWRQTCSSYDGIM